MDETVEHDFYVRDKCIETVKEFMGFLETAIIEFNGESPGDSEWSIRCVASIRGHTGKVDGFRIFIKVPDGEMAGLCKIAKSLVERHQIYAFTIPDICDEIS